jgi:nitrogen fixation NifU-like protein
MEHNRLKKNFKVLPDTTHQQQGINVTCGDEVWICVKADENSNIEDIGFQGHGCAICIASASIMTMLVKGKTFLDAHSMVEEFRGYITEPEIQPSKFGDKVDRYRKAFEGIRELPGRVKCAMLPWHTLSGALGPCEVKQEDR